MMEKHKKNNPRINLEHSSKKNILFLIFLDSIVMTMKYSVNPQKASTPEGRVGASWSIIWDDEQIEKKTICAIQLNQSV